MKGLLVVAISLLSVLFALPALAQARAVIKPLGSGAPLELRLEGDAYVGQLTVENAGTEPLKGSKLAIRPGSAGVPRMPPTVSVTFDEGRGVMAPIAPGTLRTATVRWPIKSAGPREIFGHVVVESDNAEPALLGVVAERPQSFLSARALTLLFALPFAGVLVLLALHFARSQRLRKVSLVAAGVAALQLALALRIHWFFDSTLTRYHGSEGFQFIEAHALAPSLGVQYLLGVDGISAAFVVLVPLLLLIAAWLGASVHQRPIRFWILMLLVEAGLIGSFVFLDLALWMASFVLAAVSAVALVSGFSAGRASFRIATQIALACAPILLALMSLSASAPVTYLLDGSVAPAAYAYPELLQAALFDTGAIGPGGVKFAFSLLFLGSFVLLALPPFHGWLTGALSAAPAPVGVLLAGGLPSLGVYVLLRFGYGLVPEGFDWAATTLAVIGVLTALWGALGALGERELGRFAGYASATHSAFALLALAGLTGIGVEAALLLSLGRALGVAGLIAVAAVLRERVETADAERFGGLAAELPLLGALGGIAFLGSMALPGTLSFAGLWSALSGTFPTQPLWVLLALIPLVIAAAAHVARGSQLFLGKLPDDWRKSRFLEPHAGRFPALERREQLALGIVAALIVVLGFCPQLVTRAIDASALDQAERVQPPGPTQVAAAPTSSGRDLLAIATLNSEPP